MGTFNVSIQVGSPSGSEFRPIDALVDTGASHTLLPGNLLTSLGVVAIGQVTFQLADERSVEYDVGEARIRLDGRERTSLVIFGPDDAQPLLGATTLQLLNMAVDTVGERLFSVSGLLKVLGLHQSRPAGQDRNTRRQGRNQQQDCLEWGADPGRGRRMGRLAALGGPGGQNGKKGNDRVRRSLGMHRHNPSPGRRLGRRAGGREHRCVHRAQPGQEPRQRQVCLSGGPIALNCSITR
ncbi:MAG: hypothetical protein BZY87_04755 [SAR202 cluster bacterium Io17-Chloro-G6]|nr:MAG: hypothetical protein BZY87_04755 [SAR202 cluster bacterium Io17-Chloro-G6]